MLKTTKKVLKLELPSFRGGAECGVTSLRLFPGLLTFQARLQVDLSVYLFEELSVKMICLLFRARMKTAIDLK